MVPRDCNPPEPSDRLPPGDPESNGARPDAPFTEEEAHSTEGALHDANNMLMAALANLHMARRQLEPTHPAFRYVDDAEAACDRARTLARRLIARARHARRAPVPVRPLLDSVASLALAGMEHRCHIDVGHRLPPIQGDWSELEQALVNLVRNAAEASDARAPIRVEADEAHLPDGGWVRIRVIDRGSGIPSEALGRIFEPFYTTKARGTGLGLHGVRAIVGRHGGHLEVCSEPDRGTTFTVRLPKCTACSSRA